MTALREAPDGAKAVGRRAVATWGALTAGGRALPDYLICGAQRGGTTSLHRMLAQHPDVVSPAFHKGVHFFDTAAHYARGMDWYRGHFPVRKLADRRVPSGRARTGESSPYYVFHPLAPERIARDLPGARLVVLLRDPVERAWSAHKQETGRGFETESFERALELEDERLAGEVDKIIADPSYQSFHHQHHAYRRRGHYAEQIETLTAAVGTGRVLTLEADDVFTPGTNGWARVLDHIGLAPWGPGPTLRANARPSETLPAAVRDELSAYFQPHDEHLARVLEREPTWRRR